MGKYDSVLVKMKLQYLNDAIFDSRISGIYKKLLHNDIKSVKQMLIDTIWSMEHAYIDNPETIHYCIPLMYTILIDIALSNSNKKIHNDFYGIRLFYNESQCPNRTSQQFRERCNCRYERC